MDSKELCAGEAHGETAWEKAMPAKEELVIERKLSFSAISVCVTAVGEDYVIVVRGGNRPHIGGCVLALPRPSLSGSGMSCTSSVINVCGHKDEQILRLLAEAKCKAAGRVVLCTGGFHLDGITAEQIREVQEAAAELAKLLSE